MVGGVRTITILYCISDITTVTRKIFGTADRFARYNSMKGLLEINKSLKMKNFVRCNLM